MHSLFSLSHIRMHMHARASVSPRLHTGNITRYDTRTKAHTDTCIRLFDDAKIVFSYLSRNGARKSTDLYRTRQSIENADYYDFIFIHM